MARRAIIVGNDTSFSGSNVGLLARFKGIEIVAAGGTSIKSVDRAHSDTVNAPGIVVDASQVGLLNAIDPEG